jgi:hypothetical protein
LGAFFTSRRKNPRKRRFDRSRDKENVRTDVHLRAAYNVVSFDGTRVTIAITPYTQPFSLPNAVNSEHVPDKDVDVHGTNNK